ncbi:transposase [Thermoflexibacter ruber]|uniref:transposase n=1 Tax=Thermoflexibacter ruber TaxID=1003 RepID=UPI000B865CE7
MEWAKDIINYYRRRWSIETLFGDLESRGFNINKTSVKNPEMLQNLLILVAIAFCFTFIMGLAKPLFKDILPKIFRKNRLKSYSVFHINHRLLYKK